jgi:hypothetical protein
LATLVLAAAGLLQVALVMPTRRQVIASEDEYRRLRDQARKAEQELTEARARVAPRSRASALLARATAPADEALAELRAELLETIESFPVHGVRLEVGPQPPPLVGRFRLGATGTFRSVVALAGDLARPESGMVLEQVTFRAAPDGVTLEVQGLRVGARP